MKIRQILLVIAMGVLLIHPAPAQCQAPEDDITVEAESYGSSRDEALLKAKREAVSSGIGTMLISETEVKNYMIQKNVVLTRTLGSVKNYKVLTEGWQDQIYHMKISALVSLADIREDLLALKILIESMERPRIMVLLQEADGQAAQTAIIDFLNGKGFELVDPDAVTALTERDAATARRATEGDSKKAAKLGAACGAEYVITGKVGKRVSQTELLKEAGLNSGQATLTARVVNVSNARIIASNSAAAAAVHLSKERAMETAAAKAAHKLMEEGLFEKILASFQRSVNDGRSLDVTVENIPDFSTQKAVTALISTLDVASVNKRAYVDGMLKLSVLFRGAVEGFAEALDGKAVNGWQLATTAMVGNRVVLTMRKEVKPEPDESEAERRSPESEVIVVPAPE